MKSISQYIKSSLGQNDTVYAVYFDDNTMDSYYDTKEDADLRKDQLNKETSMNKCIVKKEPRKNFEKK